MLGSWEEDGVWGAGNHPPGKVKGESSSLEETPAIPYA